MICRVSKVTDLSQWLQTLGSSRLREEVMQGRKQKATTHKTVLWHCSDTAISVRAAPSDTAGGEEDQFNLPHLTSSVSHKDTFV